MDDRTTAAPAAEKTVSEARLMSVLNTAVDGIIVIDEQARILLYNQACEKLFGYSAAEVAGQNIKMIMPRGARTSQEWIGVSGRIIRRRSLHA
jgi:two-component system sensor kinase FixL